MPSMHVALATLYYLMARKLDRRLGAFFLVFLVIIMIGSVHLAYHYAVQDPKEPNPIEPGNRLKASVLTSLLADADIFIFNMGLHHHSDVSFQTRQTQQLTSHLESYHLFLLCTQIPTQLRWGGDKNVRFGNLTTGKIY